MVSKIKKKINKIRNSDQNTKQAWFVGISTIAMMLVVLSWTAYLNASLPMIAGPNENLAGVETNDKSGFLQAVASGSSSVFNNVREGFVGIIDSVTSPKEIEIEIP